MPAAATLTPLTLEFILTDMAALPVHTGSSLTGLVTQDTRISARITEQEADVCDGQCCFK